MQFSKINQSTAPINLRRAALSWGPEPVRFLIWNKKLQKMCLNDDWWSGKQIVKRLNKSMTHYSDPPGYGYNPSNAFNRFDELGQNPFEPGGVSRRGFGVMRQGSGCQED